MHRAPTVTRWPVGAPFIAPAKARLLRYRAYNVTMATFSIAGARLAPRTRATSGSSTWPSVGGRVAFVLAALVLLLSGGAPPPGLRVEQLAAARAFPLV